MKLQELVDKLGGFILSWLPVSFTELLLFVIVVAIIIIVISLFHYTSVQRRVRSESRCYKEKLLNRPGVGTYSVKAYAATGEEIYEVIYDLGAKTYTVTQKCKTGGVLNKVEISVYDLKSQVGQKIEKFFYCEKDFELESKPPIYSGYPGLVRFMQYDNTEFFDKELNRV